MAYKIRDIIEYIIALINEFAKRYNMSDKEAYNYLHAHKGILFIEKNYGIMHTLDFNEMVDSMAYYCRKEGGEI